MHKLIRRGIKSFIYTPLRFNSSQDRPGPNLPLPAISRLVIFMKMSPLEPIWPAFPSKNSRAMQGIRRTICCVVIKEVIFEIITRFYIEYNVIPKGVYGINGGNGKPLYKSHWFYRLVFKLATILNIARINFTEGHLSTCRIHEIRIHPSGIQRTG